MEDVVESRVYVRVHSELRRQANKQTSDVALKVGANVRTEVVAKWIGQIVDEGNKPKDEPLAKIGSVGFEGIEPIGSKDDYITSGSQHPECLMQRLPIISQVLDDLVQEDYVDGVVVEGELLGGAGEEREAAFSAGAYPLPVDVYAVHARAKLGESLNVGSDAAANVEYSAPLEPDVALDCREASFLAVAPNVTGMTSPDPAIAQVSFRKLMVLPKS